MKVYCIYIPDWEGNNFILLGIFKTLESASKYVETKKYGTIIEQELHLENDLILEGADVYDDSLKVIDPI